MMIMHKHRNLIYYLIFFIINLIDFINCKPKFNPNYVSICDENFQDYQKHNYQLIIPKLNSTNQTIQYLLINNVNNFNNCIKQCCLNDLNCDLAFFNHSSNLCLHIICNLSNQTSSCPLLKKDDNQPTSFLKIREPTLRKLIKYDNELSRDELINKYGFLDQQDQQYLTTNSNLILKNKYSKDQIKKLTKLNNLTVVVNKNIILQLPNNSIQIDAFVYPASKQYIYKWTLIKKPNDKQEDTATSSDTSSSSLKLDHLKEGFYIYNISVSTLDGQATGQASVTISVLPPKHINKPPIAIIKPNNSTVQLPKTEIVLDGGDSIDDDKIVNYKWTLIKKPIGFELPSNDLEKSTLIVKNLITGNYVFQLKVKDSDNETSIAEANVNVLKEKDYPPVAVAGADTILFLPTNNVILYGNASTDDKKIISYEWSLIDENGNKPINNMDMSGVKTPFLHLENLQVGVYKFVLKVTDSSNQSSTAETHVFVKAQVNIKPEAVAGPDQKVYMPLKEQLQLDGSKSKDVSKGGITNWHWSQLVGPRLSNIVSPDQPKTNVTNLVPGQYTFLLEITNSKNLTSNSTTKVDVIQQENEAPIANAGGNFSIECPCGIVILNGSKSSDDLIDLKYQWEKLGDSIAAGDIIDNSDKNSILKLANLITGRYLFKLTVEDNQGAKSTDIAVIDVKELENIKNFVEILLNVNYKKLKYEQENNLLKKIEIFLSSNSDETIKLLNITLLPIYDSELMMLRFAAQVIVDNKSLDLPAIEIVKRLRTKLKNDRSLIDPEILSVRTVVCQNDCSGHGICDVKTKKCNCNFWWMQNWIRFQYGDQIENCEWSIIYFFIFMFFLSVFICTFIWSFLCYFIRKRPLRMTKTRLRRIDLLKKKRSMKYTLLKQNTTVNNRNSNNHTDVSDTDSDEIEHSNRLKKVNNQNLDIKIKNGNSSKINYKDSSSESEVIYEFDKNLKRGYN